MNICSVRMPRAARKTATEDRSSRSLESNQNLAVSPATMSTGIFPPGQMPRTASSGVLSPVQTKGTVQEVTALKYIASYRHRI